jgi:predicted PurR-regulated permease PerM
LSHGAATRTGKNAPAGRRVSRGIAYSERRIQSGAEGRAIDRIAIVALAGLLVYSVYLIFAPFLNALIWAVVLVVFFRRGHEAVCRRIARPNLAALVTTTGLTLVFIVPMFLIFTMVANQTIAVTQRLVEDWRHGTGWRDLFASVQQLPFLQYLPPELRLENLREFAAQNMRQWGLFIAEHGGSLAQNVLGVTVNLLITLLASFYLFRDGPALMGLLRAVLPFEPDYRERLLAIIENVLFASVLSSFAVAAVQGALGAVAFWFVGIPAPILWGLLMMLAAFIPLVGAALIWGPAAIYFLLTGDYASAGILTFAGIFVVGTIDNILRPLLISGRVELNGLLVLISVIGGIGAFGLLGIVLGPVLISVAAAVLEAERERRAGAPPPGPAASAYPTSST